MAKFIYRMQNILDLKEKLETQARNEYAVAQAELNEEEDRLLSLIKRREAYEQKLAELYSGGIRVLEIQETLEAVEYMKYRIELQRHNIKKARKKVENERAKLQFAIQERKTQDKLKENAFEVFLEELKASESKEIDELVSYRFGAGKEG
ncbi:MAG TPA: flagellar export protein FliJ [Lachnospiraceae bacterium]|nr:flagellar export protein FliJ [Lachnospiraceae bacterium]